jgi:hypothetical protein
VGLLSIRSGKILTSTGVLISTYLPVTRPISTKLEMVNLHNILKAVLILVIWLILRIISGYNRISESLWYIYMTLKNILPYLHVHVWASIKLILSPRYLRA